MRPTKYLIFIIISITIFVSGFLFHKNKFFPYPELIQVYIDLSSMRDDYITRNNTNSLVKGIKRDPDMANLVIKPTKVELIETQTIPIKKQTFDTSNLFVDFSYSKGGICSNGEDIVITNGSGESLIINPENKKILKYLNLNEKISSKNTSNFTINDTLCFNNNFQSGQISFYLSINYVLNDRENKNQTSLVKVTYNVKTNKTIIKTVWSSPVIKVNGAGRVVSTDFIDFYISFSGSTEDPTKESKPYPEQDLDPAIFGGKIIKINTKNNTTKVMSYGHRNPQGLYIDSNLNMYSTEHGPKGGDEFNSIIDGANYGWPISTHGVDYESYKPIYGDIGKHNTHKKPIFSWGPGIGISNLVRLKNFNDSWDNDFIITSLKNKSIYRLRLDNGAVNFVEKIWIGHRIRDITTIKGNIYIWTDDKKLISLNPENYLTRGYADERQDQLVACLSCHHLGITNNTHAAPTLFDIFNKKSGSDPNFQYSIPMKNSNFIWNESRMMKYLLDPAGYLPGTIMSYRVADTTTAADIVERLKKVSKMQE